MVKKKTPSIEELEITLAEEEYEEMWKNIDHKRLNERDALHKEIVELSRKPRYTIAEEAQRQHEENFVSVDYSAVDEQVMLVYGFIMVFWFTLGAAFLLGMLMSL